MYEPRRFSGSLTAGPEADATAFRSGPRRAAGRGAGLLRTRLAPAALAVALLATSGAAALNVGAAQSSTIAVPASYRAEDSTSRDAARAPLAQESDGQAEDPVAAEALAQAAPEDTAPTASTVTGSWRSGLGTVTGEQFAQSSVVVRAQAADGAAELGTLAEGDKVTITDLTVAEHRQVSYQGKVGYVPTDKLGDEAPAKEALSAVTPTAKAGSTFFWPTQGSISSAWGMRLHPILGYTRLHGGVDIGGKAGAPIYAVQDGTVTKAATGYNSGSGNNIRIDHGSVGGKQLETAYLHMTSLKVSVGQRVKRGQVIGTVGSTGLSTAPHLHFSLYIKGVNSNPAPYLGR